mmetsp:Transcript_15557/g.28922  ORF Transcript_15557/g.28922 Transcript_15557/m.28922 type:complete len:226 (-) Transcript_15557:20-697(-)
MAVGQRAGKLLPVFVLLLADPCQADWKEGDPLPDEFVSTGEERARLRQREPEFPGEEPFSEEDLQDVLKLKLRPSLACAVCRMVLEKFSQEVARSIKGRMSNQKKRQIFDQRFHRACDPKSYPEKMAIAEENGNEGYVDAEGARTGLTILREDAEVKSEVLNACNIFVNEKRGMLLESVLSTTDGRASELNFFRQVCLQPGRVCDNDEVGGEDFRGSDKEDDADL